MTLKHESLIAWQRADDLFVDIHRLTATHFPAVERFELASQIRRAAYSVAANIVEGCARRSVREQLRFLHVAEASLAEVGYCVHVARRLGYIDPPTHARMQIQIKEVAAPLFGLIRSM